MPPTTRPLPRFVAEPPHELEPYGRWAESLGERFVEACERIDGHERLGPPAEIAWFPERTYGGRVYVPASARSTSGHELFGYVSFVPDPESGEPREFASSADWTEETAEQNPGWKLDLSEEVLGRWRGPGSAAGDLTLVWVAPLVPGGAIATAELGGETVDQCPLGDSERFALVALDAVSGLGDELYLQISLWNRRGELLATETLYEEEE
jgi:hypothetical protein